MVTQNIQRPRRRRLVLGTALACVALLGAALAGCGSDASGADSAVNAGTATGTPINVGVLGTYSGPLSADTANAQYISQAWADSVNAAGGLKGHPVKLFIEDDQGNAAQSLTLLKKLVTQDHVVAIVGSAAQGTDGSWGTYLDKVGVPSVGGLGASAPSLTSPSYFDVSTNIIAQFYGTVAVAKEYGPSFAQLYCAGSAPCESTVPVLQAFAKSLGTTLPYSAPVDSSAPDYTALCQSVKSSGVASYSASLSSDVLARVAAQCGQQGVTAQLISQISSQDMASNPSFGSVRFVDSRFPWFDDSTPATKAFHAAIAKYAPNVGTSSDPLNFIDPSVWASGKLFEAAVQAAPSGPITSASIEDGLYSLHNETLGGLTGPLNFTRGHKTLDDCYFTYALTNGKWSEPDGLTPKCAPASAVNAIVASMTKS